jgi:hypothetical protein
MLQTEFMHKKLSRAVLIPAVGCILPLTAAHADPVTYTFTGTGGGTITGGKDRICSMVPHYRNFVYSLNWRIIANAVRRDKPA